MVRYMLTTTDNPYDPFTQFDEWFMFDIEHGYNSCEYLGRFCIEGENFTEEENQAFIEAAIDEIVKYNPLGIYVKVRQETKNEYLEE